MDTKEKFIEAAKEGNLEYVKAHFSDIQNSVSRILYNPTLVGAFVFSPSIKICAYLLEKEMDINEPYRENYESNMYEFSWTAITALMYAVQTNNVEKTKFLLTNGANVNTPITEVYGEYHDSPYEPLNKRYIESPLMRAVKNGNAELVRILLEAGADANDKDKDGNTALKLAQAHDNQEIINLLKSAGAKTNSQPVQVNPSPNKQSTCSINTPDRFGETPLLKAVKKGQIEEVKNLIAQGADVNFVDQFKSSVLMTAAKKGNAEIVKCLVEAGADVNYKDNFGKSILKTAEQKGYTEIADFLKSAGAKE